MSDRTRRSEDVSIGARRVHVAHAAAPRGGVLLYPTIMGLEGSMRRYAAELATAGVTAVVWDQYDGEEPSTEVLAMLARSKRREDVEMVSELEGVVDYMRDGLDLERIAGLGWCFGGRVGLLHAGSDDRIAGLATYTPSMFLAIPTEIAGVGPVSKDDFPGQSLNEFELAVSIRGPVHLSRPERDFTLPAAYASLFEALCRRTDRTLYEFHPGADHGFSYVPGAANERAHRASWSTTRTLLADVLGDAS